MGSGRSTSALYRRNRLLVLAASDLCHLCGHHGARTCDHIIPPAQWPAGQPGLDDIANLAPAHGTMGSGVNRVHNPCPVCGRLCNQARGNRIPVVRPQSRPW